MSDREHDILLEVFKLLDSHDVDIKETGTVLLNLISFVTITLSHSREEYLVSLIADLPAAINFLAKQVGLEFDWELFKELKDVYAEDSEEECRHGYLH